MRGKTTLIISHDPGLIRCADRIMVISEGRIVESGGHQELISARGLYSELYLRVSSSRNSSTPTATGTARMVKLWYGAEPEYAVVVPRRAQQAPRRRMTHPDDRRVWRCRSSAAASRREAAGPGERAESRAHGAPHRANVAPARR